LSLPRQRADEEGRDPGRDGDPLARRRARRRISRPTLPERRNHAEERHQGRNAQLGGQLHEIVMGILARLIGRKERRQFLGDVRL
jgi:hypothetical protein